MHILPSLEINSLDLWIYLNFEQSLLFEPGIGQLYTYQKYVLHLFIKWLRAKFTVELFVRYSAVVVFLPEMFSTKQMCYIGCFDTSGPVGCNPVWKFGNTYELSSF